MTDKKVLELTMLIGQLIEQRDAAERRAAEALREALLSLPQGLYDGAHRYNTDDEFVLNLWRDGQSREVRAPRNTA